MAPTFKGSPDVNHELTQDITAMPGRSDLIRLAIGTLGIGSSGPLIAMSTMPILTLVFLRNLAGSLLTLPFALRNKFDRTGAKWAAAAGVLLALHFMGFFAAMRMTSVAAGTALVALQPIFASIFVKVTGGHIPPKAWLGMAVSFAGVLLISGIDFSIDRRSFIGDLAALISAALAALYMMCGSRAMKTLETSTYTSICYGVCALTALPVAIVSGSELIHFPAREWWILLGLLVGAQFLGHSMFNSVLKRVSPAVVSLIVFFEVPIAAILAGIFNIGKQPSGFIIPGMILILAGCTMVVLRTRPAREMVRAEVLE
jgi:drug/metabolite transporter (DMT)-like permease